ncbi:MAG: glycosyltransferase family 9 protein [Aquabacterium sp.]|nr:glycosyltransferase family 9 protein [Aquabacterium sp.]
MIVRLCNMVGDVVLGLPALQLLEAQGYDLHLYGKGWAKTLLAGHGWPCTTRAGKLGARIDQLRQLRRQCLQADPSFDNRINTLVMPNSFSSAFEMRWAGLKPAGYARDGRSLLLAKAWRPSPPAHAVDGFWELATRLTTQAQPTPDHIHLKVPAQAQDQADKLLAAHGIHEGFICIVPYAAGDVDGKDKRWPEFAAFTQQLAAVHPKRQIITCPGPGENDIARLDHPAALLLPGVALDVYLGILKRAALVISNDTGPAHMAAAVGAPVLSVLGPTNPDQWRPWGPQNRIAQGAHRQWPSVDAVMDMVSS